MKKLLLISISILLLLPVIASSNPIDAVSSTLVGNNINDMNGMEVTVYFAGGGSETSTWTGNSATGTGWSMGYGGNDTGYTGTDGLDWTFTAGANAVIDKFEINAYANQRVFFDVIFDQANERSPGSDNGFWGPNIDLAVASGIASQTTQGISDGTSPYFSTTGDYGAAFQWAFTNPVALPTGPLAATYGDLFEMLTIDFNYQAVTGAPVGSAFSDGTFNFAVDTDLVAGTEIPEPSTILLFGLGLLGMGAIGRKKV